MVKRRGRKGGKRQKASPSKKKKKVGQGWKLKEPQVVTVQSYQTGKTKNILMDRKRKALPPGWRISKSGKRYYESRKNRSDMPGDVM